MEAIKSTNPNHTFEIFKNDSTFYNDISSHAEVELKTHEEEPIVSILIDHARCINKSQKLYHHISESL